MITKPSRSLDRQLGQFDRPLVVSTYFGFIPIKSPRISQQDVDLVKHCGGQSDYDARDKVSLIRTYLEQDLASLSHPLALIYKKTGPQKGLGGYALHFIGTISGIAEATLIRTALSILREEGYDKLRVDLNCIGDRESINIYERELINYFRKFGHNLSEELKKQIKEDIFNLFRIETAEILSLRDTAPSSVTFLSLQSRIHFREVLEYIEALGIEFRLSPHLVGEKNHTSHAIFAIKNVSNDNQNTLAVGYRYSNLARLFGLRKEIPMAGVNIFASSFGEKSGQIYKELPKPKFYLIQMGQEAKIKTLSLIETLRLHRIPLHHFLGKDKITVQLSNAENLRVPYIIIIGQKEALDNTATVRNTRTRAQDTVKIEHLPHYLKHITL